MHRWPAAAELEGRKEGRDGGRGTERGGSLAKAGRINNQLPLLDESHSVFAEYRRRRLSADTPYGPDGEERR